MNDWKENGRRVFDRCRAAHRELADAFAEALDQLRRKPVSVEATYINALRAYATGAPSKLAEHVRSGKPIQREWLAQVLEGDVWRPKIGRPKNSDIWCVALAARCIYRDWKAENQQTGISSRGHADDMKEEAVKIAMELELDADWKSEEKFYNEVILFMSRSKLRQN